MGRVKYILSEVTARLYHEKNYSLSFHIIEISSEFQMTDSTNSLYAGYLMIGSGFLIKGEEVQAPFESTLAKQTWLPCRS